MDSTPKPSDEALARLRAADPAHDAEPDAGALDSAIARAVAGSAGGMAADRTIPDELATRRRRRNALSLAAAAAVIAVAAAGGGYAVGSNSSTPVVSTAEPALATGTPPVPQTPAGAPLPAQGLAPASEGGDAVAGSSQTGRDAADIASLPGNVWGFVFHGDGLSTKGGQAEAFAYDAAAAFSANTAQHAAQVLGVPGDLVLESGSYRVGPEDGTKPVIRLQADGQATLWFDDPTKNPWYCVKVIEGQEGGGSGAYPIGSEECGDQSYGPPPSAAAAKEQLQQLLTDLGVDLTAYTFTADQPVDAGPDAAKIMNIQGTAGQDAALPHQVTATFSSAGLVNLYARLAPMVSLGKYDIISPAEAVARLGDPRFGPVQTSTLDTGVLSTTEPGNPDSAVTAPDTAPTVPPMVTAGKVPWPVADVTITKATLGLTERYTTQGSAMAVPTYSLSDSAGRTWSVIAVVDDQLDFTGQ